MAKAASNPWGKSGLSNNTMLPKSLHPQDLDPFSRVCTAKLHDRLAQMSGIIDRKSPHLMHLMRPNSYSFLHRKFKCNNANSFMCNVRRYTLSISYGISSI